MKKYHLAAGGMGILIVLAGYGWGGEDGAPPAAAVVNGREISSADLEREIARLPDPRSAESRALALKVLIERRLLLDEAERRGLSRRPELQDQWEALVIDRLLREKLGAALTVNEEDVADFYRKNPSAFVIPESRRVRQIVVGEEWEAEKIRERLENGRDFAMLAQDHSLEPFAVNYGDLGYITKASVVPELAAAAFSLRKGEFCPPLRTRFGWHVIEVLDIKPARRQSFQEASATIRERLTASRREQVVGGWIADLRSAAAIEIRDEALRPTPPPPGRE